ncbi:hypothetical protein [Neosynechococcus sphagnicola]|nr:hypothetical protein [Neosynechococcus sphagnicola]
MSSQRAKTELGWEPTTSFEEGVRRYIDWYRTREVSRQAAWAQVDDLLKS